MTRAASRDAWRALFYAGSKKLVLASASPRRATLLQALGVEFTVQVPRVAEGAPTGDPARFAREAAVRKAGAVRVTGNALVIAADTVVWIAGRGLGKPAGRDEAREMLLLLRGVRHEVYTGVAVASPGTGRVLDAVERTAVRMRSYSEEEIEAYLDSGEPLDKAGAYGIQGLGALLVEGIEGDYYNVMGLPLRRLAVLLGEFEEIERASGTRRAGRRT